MLSCVNAPLGTGRAFDHMGWQTEPPVACGTSDQAYKAKANVNHPKLEVEQQKLARFHLQRVDLMMGLRPDA
jgi:hypothetical protein